MKKIVALLFTCAVFATSFAQGNYQKSRHGNDEDGRYRSTYGKNYDHRKHNWENQNTNYSTGQQKGQRIQHLNREYQYKMMAVQNNRYMNRRQKRQALRDLQQERLRKIQMINAGYNQVSGRNYDYNRRQKW